MVDDKVRAASRGRSTQAFSSVGYVANHLCVTAPSGAAFQSHIGWRGARYCQHQKSRLASKFGSSVWWDPARLQHQPARPVSVGAPACHWPASRSAGLVLRRQHMVKGSLINLVGGAAAAALFCILPVATHAAPVSSTTRQLASQAVGTSNVEHIVDRRRVQHGRRSTGRPRVYGYTSPAPKGNPGSGLPSYGMPQPHEYPFGSAAWWRSMQSTGHIR